MAFCMVWYGHYDVIQYGMVGYGMVWQGVLWYGINVVWYPIIRQFTWSYHSSIYRVHCMD
jgi:hypothetical protein